MTSRALLGAFLLLLLSCADPASKLPQFDKIPAFSMIDTGSHPFSAENMDGKVWIVDFIYTNCPAECPRMSSQMHKVENELHGESAIHFLSISVDPTRDTPPVLKTFAQRWGAPNSQWHFLTGTPQTVHLLAYSTFHVGDVIDKIEHSTKFALVDKHRIIRGYYSSFDPESLAQLRRDAQSLQASR